jgi:hypothetical protein
VEKNKKFKYDGRSRPSDNKYRKRWKEIFGKVVNTETTVKDLKQIIKGVKEDERQTKSKK